MSQPVDALAGPWQTMATVDSAIAPEVGSLLETEPLLGTSIEEAFGRQALAEVGEVGQLAAALSPDDSAR